MTGQNERVQELERLLHSARLHRDFYRAFAVLPTHWPPERAATIRRIARHLERLFSAAAVHTLDVLLEHPGERWRLALQTTRAGVRSGAPYHRQYTALGEVRGSLLERAAQLLVDELTRNPPGSRS